MAKSNERNNFEEHPNINRLCDCGAHVICLVLFLDKSSDKQNICFSFPVAQIILFPYLKAIILAHFWSLIQILAFCLNHHGILKYFLNSTFWKCYNI